MIIPAWKLFSRESKTADTMSQACCTLLPTNPSMHQAPPIAFSEQWAGAWYHPSLNPSHVLLSLPFLSALLQTVYSVCNCFFLYLCLKITSNPIYCKFSPFCQLPSHTLECKHLYKCTHIFTLYIFRSNNSCLEFCLYSYIEICVLIASRPFG